MANENPSFLSIESQCKILQRLASQFPEESEEYEALASASAALISHIVDKTNRQFDRFSKLSSHSEQVQSMLSEWIERNPTAPVGKSVVIGGQLYVVTADFDRRLRLVRVRSIEEDDNYLAQKSQSDP